MKYISINHPEHFEYHDAHMTLISFEENCLSVNVRHLNIHADAPENTEGCDMEIQSAIMTFEGFNLLSYLPGVAWETDENNISHPASPIITHYGYEATQSFRKELAHGIRLMSFSTNSTGQWELCCVGEEPYFEVSFTFDRMTVAWNEYRCPAWYVLRERGIMA